MKIVVVVKLVPDLVEEIEIDGDGKTVDTTFMRLIINEPDDHALEQAIILKEREGGEVTILGPNMDDIDGIRNLHSLKQAATNGDSERLYQVIADIKSHNPGLADELIRLTDDFAFDTIFKVIQKLLHTA